MSTVLFYAMTTNPFPLQASAGSGNPNKAQLTVVATNNTIAAVTLQGVIVQLPVGDGATELTADPTGIGAVPPGGWTLQQTTYPEGFVQYLFYPGGGQQSLEPDQSLTFIFNNVSINTEPGTCEVVITEGTANNPTVSLDVTKFPNGWGEVTFWLDPTIIPYQGGTTVYWDGPTGATYTIDYWTPASGPVHVPGPGQPALGSEGQYPTSGSAPLQLTQNTTFYLTVVDNINNQNYEARQQATVTVETPPPTITSLDGTVEESGGQTMLVVNWQTTQAEYCQITGDPHLLSPNSTGGEYKIYATSSDPLLMSYTLTATNTVGQASAQLNAVWAAQTVSGWSNSGMTTNLCVSPDSTQGWWSGVRT